MVARVCNLTVGKRSQACQVRHHPLGKQQKGFVQASPVLSGKSHFCKMDQSYHVTTTHGDFMAIKWTDMAKTLAWHPRQYGLSQEKLPLAESLLYGLVLSRRDSASRDAVPQLFLITHWIHTDRMKHSYLCWPSTSQTHRGTKSAGWFNYHLLSMGTLEEQACPSHFGPWSTC